MTQTTLRPRPRADVRGAAVVGAGVTMTAVSSWTSKLLVAVPHPYDCDDDDIFTRSVVFLLHHGSDGAQGLVLNHPLETGVDEVLPGWQPLASTPNRLFQGGPVALEMAIALANVPGHDETLGAKRLYGSLSLVDLDAPTALLEAEIAGLRIFAGSAGWDAGQLEQEVRDGVWVLAESEIGDVFDPEPQTLWQRVLRRQTAPTRYLASFPRDPQWN